MCPLLQCCLLSVSFYCIKRLIMNYNIVLWLFNLQNCYFQFSLIFQITKNCYIIKVKKYWNRSFDNQWCNKTAGKLSYSAHSGKRRTDPLEATLQRERLKVHCTRCGGYKQIKNHAVFLRNNHAFFFQWGNLRVSLAQESKAYVC